MAKERMFINKSDFPSLEGKYPLYVINGGKMRRILPEFLANRLLAESNFWITLDDLPERYRTSLQSFALSESVIQNGHAKRVRSNRVRDKDNVLVYVNDQTPLLPAMNHSVSDEIPVFTVERQSDVLVLSPILTCRGKSKGLFTGETEYGANVFVLASDLSKDVLERYIDDIISLEEVPAYIESVKKDDETKRFD